MKRFAFFFCGVFTSLLSAADRPTDDFAAFRLIAERNIFDPNRVDRSGRGANPDALPPADAVITLVGTLQYEKGLFAFFDGTDPRHTKVIGSGEKIAGFTVTRIVADSVDLEREGVATHLKVAQQLRRAPVEGAEWVVATPADSLPSTPEVAIVTDGAASSPTDTSAKSSRALKRLLEKRQKQLKE